MSSHELTEKNYRRISYINWALSIPLLFIFSWPYFFLSSFLDIHRSISYPGALFFGLPFMLTILHGHVTMALGAAHRNLYYSWLDQKPLTFGLVFHPVITSTRFRLFLFFISLILLITGFLLHLY